MCARGARHLRQRPQHRRVQRLVERRDARVRAVDRQQVLDQVVRADAEEVDLGREQVGDHGRARHLEVHAHGDVLVEVEPVCAQAGPGLLQQRQGDAQVRDPAHEREHDAHRPVVGRAQQRAQLHPERLRAARRSRRSARSPSAGLGLDGPDGPQRLEADVPGADGDRVRVHLLEQPAVDVELLLLARPAQAAAEQVLGAEQADPLRAVLLRRRRLLGELDVRLAAAPRRRRACAPAGRASRAAAPPPGGSAPAPARKPSSARARRLEHHLAARAVDHQRAARRRSAGSRPSGPRPPGSRASAR